MDATFKSVFVPEQHVTVDESLWRYKGRHHAIQFNPSKRARFGLKVYKLCASGGPSHGYTSAFKVYMGQDRSEIPASQRAVRELMDRAGLFDLGYELYLDNWYSSPHLFHYLQSRRTNAIGTVRTDRKAMPRPKLQVKKKGDFTIRSSRTGMLCLAWMDKRQVTLLSTVHTGKKWVSLPPAHDGTVRRKPLAVADYNKGMCGVDLSDQLAISYPTRRKCKKWYHNLFFRLVDTAIVNALCVHKYLGGTLDQKAFRMKLLKSFLTARLRGGPRELQPHRQLHRQVQLPRRRRCQECAKTKRRKELKWGCSHCNVALCPGECFWAYHRW